MHVMRGVSRYYNIKFTNRKGVHLFFSAVLDLFFKKVSNVIYFYLKLHIKFLYIMHKAKSNKNIEEFVYVTDK